MIYKIGLDLYRNENEDKNCGLFEYKMIEEKIKDSTDRLYIINGMLNENDKTKLSKWFNIFKKEKRIFILTDLSLFANNKEIIEECGVLLHSSKDENFGKDIVNKSFYSYIPDMYFEEDRKKVKLKSNIITFGGSFGGKILEDECLKRYIVSEDGRINDKILFIYKSNEIDSRVCYNEFKKILDLSRYSLCVKRKEFVKYRWVTPRLLDCISSYCFPLVDRYYDEEYRYPDILKCDNYYDAIKVIDLIDEEGKEEIIMKLRELAKEKKEKFLEIISEF